MEIEAGKYYLTRDGNKVGPMVASPITDRTFYVLGKQMVWEKGGKSSLSAHHDIISEWVDESNELEWYDDSYVYTKGKSPVKLDKTVTYDNLLDVDWSKFEWSEPPTSFIPTVDTSDNVNSPSHYNQAGIECIDAIKASLGDGYQDYCKGNVMKYLWRYKYKNGIEDLKKAQWYLNSMVADIDTNKDNK